LLAAANALLLRGVIDLPSQAIRTGAASIDDVVNILADYALLRHKNDHQTHHLDELLSVFPSLQFGMDVNPKFNAGPTGVEYTSNLNAFDCLHVELVHGWLIDPQDETTCQLIGNKTYNELIEMVIQGNDASAQLERLSQELSDVTAQLDLARFNKQRQNEPEQVHEPEQAHEEQQEQQLSNTATSSVGNVNTEEGWVEVVPSETTTPTVVPDMSATNTPPASQGDQEADLQIKVLQERLEQLQQKERDLTTLSMKSLQIAHFLSTTSHQLTHYGLLELYAKVSEDDLCVFFRNNHFCTMTKHDGVLYMLVTDLGYANVHNVVWEKLDGIDGDTEYVSSNFTIPAPQPELLPAGSALSPEQLLAQQGQTEADYQLALRLSQDPNATIPNQRNLDQEEGRLMAAATEASLREYNGFGEHSGDVVPTVLGTDAEVVASAPPEAEANLVADNMPVSEDEGVEVDAATVNRSSQHQEDADKALAMQLQAEWENEVVARRLQEQEEQNLLAASRQRPTNRPIVAGTATRPNAGSTSSGCVIS
jgi:hypothetical protein